MKKSKYNKLLVASLITNAILLVALFLPWAWNNPNRILEDDMDKMQRFLEKEHWLERYLGMSSDEWAILWNYPFEGESAATFIFGTDHAGKETVAWNEFFWGSAKSGGLNFILLLPLLLSAIATFLIWKAWKDKSLLAWFMVAPFLIFALCRWRLDVQDVSRIALDLDLGWGFWISSYALIWIELLMAAKILAPKNWKW